MRLFNFGVIMFVKDWLKDGGGNYGLSLGFEDEISC